MAKIETPENGQEKPEVRPVCGIVMPISGSDNYTAEHWVDVYNILEQVIDETGFKANLVSNADESGIIQRTIISNLYSNDIVICDVSSKNPNVMFELGLRLAFDKATIIVKDDKTDYSFDTAIIEHLSYPKDLRFNKINNFKGNLKIKLLATFEKSKDPKYSTFLKSFGEYKIAKLSEEEVSPSDYFIRQFDELKDIMRAMQLNNIPKNSVSKNNPSKQAVFTHIETEMVNYISSAIKKNEPIDIFKFLNSLRESKIKSIAETSDYGIYNAVVASHEYITKNYQVHDSLRIAFDELKSQALFELL